MRTNRGYPRCDKYWFAQSENGYEVGSGDQIICEVKEREDAVTITNAFNKAAEDTTAQRQFLERIGQLEEQNQTLFRTLGMARDALLLGNAEQLHNALDSINAVLAIREEA